MNARKVVFAALFFLWAGRLIAQDMVATTSVLSSVISDVAGGRLKVLTLVPSGSCPGHFDLKAGDLKTLERDGLLFAHGFEGYLDRIRDSVRRPGFSPFIIKVNGSWLLPPFQEEAYRKITGIMCVLFPRDDDFFRKREKDALSRIKAAGVSARKMVDAGGMRGVPVVCNEHIREFLEYAGLDVKMVYGRKEDLTASRIRDIILIARRSGAGLVVDNIQAGPDTGVLIARQLGIPHVAVSNFPGVFPNTPTLMKTLQENVRRIVEAYDAKNKS